MERNKNINLSIEERNFISCILDSLSINGSVSIDELKMFNYSKTDIGKLRDHLLHPDLI